MKFNKLLYAVSALLLMLGVSACEDEKELKIIEGNLPIKSSTLYMIGDATPTGWSVDAPTELEKSEDDPFVYTWEGPLTLGEIKMCLVTGSYDVPFIRPQNAGEQINKNGLDNVSFKMHAGDPDDKWKVTEAGIYNLRFDLRNWTMSATYVREQDAPVKEPIDAENVYLVGDFNEWNINAPTQLQKKSQYEFVYEGPLTKGELKACIETGSWDTSFIRPTSNGVKIGKNGVENDEFTYSTSPDNKWLVEDDGLYRLTLDLNNWKISVEYTGAFTPAPKLYMIGSATEGGWSWDAATVIVASDNNHDLFVWEGELGRGTFKASREKDFAAPFYRPAFANCSVSEQGVADKRMVFTDNPDDQWEVVKAGKYRLTFNTANMTFEAKFLDAVSEATPLYIIGDATPGGWSQDDAARLTPVDGVEGEYTWTGTLKQGNMKAFSEKDPSWGQNFYRPSSANVEISKNGVAASDMVFTTSPDDQWKIVDEGKYKLTLNIKTMTISAKYLD